MKSAGGLCSPLALSGGAQQDFLPVEAETAQKEKRGPFRHSTFRKTKVRALPELIFFHFEFLLYVLSLTQSSLKSMLRLLLTLMSSGSNPKAIQWSKLPPNCKYEGVYFALQIEYMAVRQRCLGLFSAGSLCLFQMPSSFTGLFIIWFIRLNKLARFNLAVKQKQLKAAEVSEWSLASLPMCIVLFSCWPLVWESLFSWYICSTHVPQHHEKSPNTEPAAQILQWAGQISEAVGRKSMHNRKKTQKVQSKQIFYFKAAQKISHFF